MIEADEIAIKNFESKLNRLMEGYTRLAEENAALRKQLTQQSVQFEKAREQYAKKSSAANKKIVESAEAGLKDLTDKYKLETGEEPQFTTVYKDYHLGAWCNYQRQLYKQGKLSSERIQKLTAVGFPLVLKN